MNLKAKIKELVEIGILPTAVETYINRAKYLRWPPNIEDEVSESLQSYNDSDTLWVLWCTSSKFSPTWRNIARILMADRVA